MENDPAYQNNAKYFCNRAEDAAPEGMMAKSVYDPNGQEQDVFAYAEDKAKAVNIAVNDTYGITNETPTPAGGLTKESFLQTIIDKVSDWLINKLVSNENFQTKLTEYIVNNGTANLAGFVMDARQGNPNIEGSLAKQISELNANGPTYFYLRYNSTNGYLDLSYIYVKDLVILAGIFVINIETPSYSITGNVPKSIIPNGFLVYDTLGEYRFQINPIGIFQNSDALPAGTYIVTTAYIKS